MTFGSGTEHLFFVGHLDEVGYVVTQINEDGTLSVERRGGFYDKYYEARPVMIYTRRGAVSGIITPRLDYFRGLPDERLRSERCSSVPGHRNEKGNRRTGHQSWRHDHGSEAFRSARR